MEDTMAVPHLLQVFLGKHGVHEVSVTPVDHDLECTCPGFQHRQSCKHVRYIRENLTECGGYVVTLPDGTPEDALERAAASPETWRDFVIHNAPVVVL